MGASKSFEDRYDRLTYCLKSLADMSETISGVRSIGKSARSILHIVMGTTGASKGAILTLEGRRLVVTAARGAKAGHSYTASFDMLSELEKTEKNMFLCGEPGIPKLLENFCGSSFTGYTPAVAVVLRAQNRTVGLLLLSNRFMNQPYGEDDLEILEAICHHVSVALYNFSLRKKAQEANFLLSHKVLQLESLHDVGLSVAAFKPKREMLQEILFGSISLLDAKKAFYIEIADGKLIVDSRAGVDEDQLSEFLNNPVYSKKVLSGKSMLFRSSRVMKGIFGSETFLAVPVKTPAKLFGMLALIGKESKERNPSFSKDDEKLLMAFATQAAVALKNFEMQENILEQERIKKELETAASIHRLIVPNPQDLPRIEGFEIYGYNYPCKEVGGDYFDVIAISESCFGFAICDVTGKGLPAALLVSTLQATLHSLLHSNLSLTEIADRMNSILYANTTLDKFATGFIGIIDTSNRSMETVNAGHNEPILLRPGGDFEKLGTGGFCFGMFDFTKYSSQITELSPGDTIYLYTDGLSEAFSPDGEEYGSRKLERLICEKAGSHPREMLLEVEKDIRDWTGQHSPSEGFEHDDFTHLAIQVT